MLVYRIDRLGRSLLDGIDPSTASGRLQLGLFATLAEYERELINERVRAGVMAAKARGVKFGQQPIDETTAEDKVETARRLLSEGKTAERVAETVGWSRATLYRYLKMYGHETPAKGQAQLDLGPGKSRYSKRKNVPVRR
ncbi:recombinase family protein [Arthrobacter sp. FB24]|uniref:recombinase family protein n=1 Tax=Arthrobacter sp. (strain FB24) TaxID=290399 RepID=UPI0000527627